MLANDPGDAVRPPFDSPGSLLNVLRGESRTLVLEGYLFGSGEVGLDPRGDAMRVLGALVTSSALASSSSLRPEIKRLARGLSVLSPAGVEEVLDEEALAGWRLFMAC